MIGEEKPSAAILMGLSNILTGLIWERAPTTASLPGVDVYMGLERVNYASDVRVPIANNSAGCFSP